MEIVSGLTSTCPSPTTLIASRPLLKDLTAWIPEIQIIITKTAIKILSIVFISFFDYDIKDNESVALFEGKSSIKLKKTCIC